MRRDVLTFAVFVLLEVACQRRGAPRPLAGSGRVPAAVRIARQSSIALGAAAAPSLPPPAAPRVYVKNRYVFVRARPDVNADWLGFLWFGSSVALRSIEPHRGPGCRSFYRIEPDGFVCVDGQQATLSAQDPVFELVSAYAPRLDRAAPHRYAESRGSVLRAQLPGHESAWPALPKFFHEPRRRLLPLSTVAYVDEASVDGQSWLLSADLLWINKEQVRLYPEIGFHGVELGKGIDLPLAFFRRSGSAKFLRTAGSGFAKSGQSFALHEVVALRPRPQIEHGQRYFETAQGDDWVREQDAVLPTAQSFTPWGARVGQEDRTRRAPNNERQTWIEVSVLGGWLLAYEGTHAVYATLVSPGRGGIPQEGKNTLEIAATPLGTFPISGKLATVTMQAPGEYVHSDVPWTQNFQKPYAIHGAYWHDNWGNPQSGGCINVSPLDGKWLFDFSEPRLPPGWHAVRWQATGPAPTVLVVHE